jgi:hypothetical protein
MSSPAELVVPKMTGQTTFEGIHPEPAPLLEQGQVASSD